MKELEEKNRQNSDRWQTYSCVLSILGALSLIACIAGGGFWYFKSQKLIDKQLVLEATSDDILKLKLNAAKVFNSMLMNLYPVQYWEELEYEDYLQYIARDFEAYYDKIKGFREKYSLIFDNKMIKEIKAAESLCEQGKFEVDGGGDVTNSGLEKAEKLIKKMEEINTKIKEGVSIYTH